MKVLICLNVKYGYPLSTLYGFVQRNDFLVWDAHLSQFTNAMVANELEGQIFWLVDDCRDFVALSQQVYELPLLKEEFLEIKILKLSSFSNLDSFFSEGFEK